MPLEAMRKKLQAAFGDKARKNVTLAPMTSFGIGGPADLLVAPADEQDLMKLMAIVQGPEIPFTVLGGGSNILVMDGGIRGVTVWMGQGFKRIEARTQGDAVLVSCGASLTTAEVLAYCIAQDLAGFEFASGIPGTLGGAIRGNAGTRDGAMGHVIRQICFVDEGGSLVTLPREKLSFRYRGLDLAGRFVITSGVLELRPGSGDMVREKRDKIIQWRRERQPYDLPSAGSVFVNPEEGSAGRMIEQAGCKGWRVGGAQVSEKHANFIVNTGGATAANVLELIDRVRRCVFDKFGVLLETEINVVGEGR